MDGFLFEKSEGDSAPSIPPSSASAGRPRLRVPVRDQVELHWAALDELLEPEHSARTVWAAVCGWDLSRWSQAVKAVEGGVGRDATDPRLLVSLWVYAALDGKRLREGIIGDVLVAKCWNIQRRGLLSPGKDTPPPAGFDYDSWVGPATMIPYRTNRVHNRWTMWYHFVVGEAGNDGVHDIDYTRWGLGVETHPTKISANGGKFHFNDETEFPDTQQATFEYPGDGKPGSQRLLI